MSQKPPVAIIDYGLGNLFSVRNACAAAGLQAVITTQKKDILDASVVILPGVGAFGDAMENLARLDLVSVLRNRAAAGQLIVGICLGLQLLMTESEEFGRHRGLGLIDGPVVRFSSPRRSDQILKVPQVGWNRVFPKESSFLADASKPTIGRLWDAPVMRGLPEGAYMYFVHSFYACPANKDDVLSLSRYGDTDFCSGLQRANVIAFQFHPERSGPSGLRIYRNIAAIVMDHEKHASSRN